MSFIVLSSQILINLSKNNVYYQVVKFILLNLSRVRDIILK